MTVLVDSLLKQFQSPVSECSYEWQIVQHFLLVGRRFTRNSTQTYISTDTFNLTFILIEPSSLIVLDIRFKTTIPNYSIFISSLFFCHPKDCKQNCNVVSPKLFIKIH